MDRHTLREGGRRRVRAPLFFWIGVACALLCVCVCVCALFLCRIQSRHFFPVLLQYFLGQSTVQTNSLFLQYMNMSYSPCACFRVVCFCLYYCICPC